MLLEEKHKIAVSEPKYLKETLDKSIQNLEEHSNGKDISVWHINQTKDITIKQFKELESLSKAEKEQLPLYGTTVGVKDLFSVKGMLNTAGSKILANYVAPYDSTVTNQIKSAGSLITGKTSMDEFAMGSFTNTSFYGKTSIPGYQEYTPGGSSGGSSASLFAELFDYTVGSDTGGSVRQPSAFCGLVGYKPSYGAFSRYGMISYASSLDQAGFMTKNTDDLFYLMSSLDTRKDLNDPTTTGLKKDFISHDITNVKIGYFAKLLESDSLSSEIKKAYKEKLDILKSSGITLESIDIPLLKHAAEIYYIIACAEASSNLARYQGVYFGQDLNAFIKDKKFDSYWDSVAQYRDFYFGSEVKKRIILGTYVISSENFNTVYKKAILLRKQLKQQINQLFSKVSYLILPTFPTLTPKWEEIEKMTTAQIYLADYMTIGFSLAGLPVVTIPTTKQFHIKETTGLQLVGQQYQDFQLIKDSISIEKHIRT